MKIYTFSNKIKICFMIIISLFCVTQLYSEPVIQIESYETNFNFTNMSVVNIQKGDSQEFREPGFDDSKWETISLPSGWGELYPDYDGICWYRIHVKFPGELPLNSLGVKLGTITDADEIYFNGELIGKSGSVDPPEVSSYDKQRLYEIPTSLIKPGEDNVIAIRVRGLFSYSNGPFTGSFIIGNHSNLLTDLLSRDFIDLFLVVIYLVVAMYFFIFFIRRREDKENILFALFALGMGLYFTFRSQGKYLIDADFFIAKKMEYLVLSTLIALLVEFLVVYFKKRHTIAHFIFFGLSGIHFLVFLFSNSLVFWDTYNLYVQLPSWGLGVILCFITLITSFRENSDARLMLYALIILLGTMINDILLNIALYHFIRLTSYGFVFFVLAIAVILSNSFVRLHKEVQNLNKNLEKRVTERTAELNLSVADLEIAKAETDNLLENVKEGIFLLDRDFIIGNNHSKMLETIFEKKELGGVNLVNLLFELTGKKNAEQTKDFLEIALTRRLSEKRLNILNPIDEIKIEFEKNAEFFQKYVRFNFTRIGEKGNYSHLLVTVQDVTEEKLLEEKIKESEEHAEEEIQLLLGILHLDPDIVGKFLEESKNDIELIEKNLESASFTENLNDLLTDVYRSVHSIKGNASVLGLQLFSTQAHEFEEHIQTLFKKEKLTSIDLLDLLYSIVGTKDALKQVEELLLRITGFQNEFGSTSGTVNDRGLLIQTANSLVNRVAERESKEIDLVFEDFDIPDKDGFNFTSLKKILIQLIKNAVTHGIETPAEREASGKNRKGKITISGIEEQNSFKMTVVDDGKGIQIDSLYKKAIKSGAYTEEELSSWPRQKLGQLIFTKGLSTQVGATLDAGRGMGMDIVRHEVSQLEGKIGLSSKPGNQTKFTIIIPV